MTPTQESKLAHQLTLDELFDLSLYRKLREISGPEVHKTLDELIVVEARHFAFWKDFFKIEVKALGPGRRLKLWFITQVCRLFGLPAVDLVLEAIEVYGVRKYLTVWEQYKGKPLGEAVKNILRDEFEHEDTMVSRLKVRIINPDRIRSIFFGLNDGMVEILGAVSGFFASLGHSSLVLIAGLTTAVAGSLSMAAGGYVAASSENEVRRTQEGKARFLEETTGPMDKTEPALRTALIVGVSYFIGASFPLLPVLFGARSPGLSILTGGTMVVLVSVLLAFLSGMDVKKRAAINLFLVTAAVGISYGIGLLVRDLFGVNLG